MPIRFFGVKTKIGNQSQETGNVKESAVKRTGRVMRREVPVSKSLFVQIARSEVREVIPFRSPSVFISLLIISSCLFVCASIP